MTQHIREHSGDAYAAWEEPKVTRQGYANAQVTELLKRPGIKKFAQLLEAFRTAGWEYDRWQAGRGA